MTKRAAKPTHARPESTTRLVGYRELRDWYGWPKSTLVEWVRDGKFPKGMMMPGNRTVWRFEDIEGFIQRRSAGLAAAAVSDASKLTPDELATALGDIGKRLTGRDVTGFTYALNDEERTAALAANAAQRQASMDKLMGAYARLDPVRAWLVVRGIMPALRPDAEDALERLTGHRDSASQDEARALAIDILDQAIDGQFVGPGGTRVS